MFKHLHFKSLLLLALLPGGVTTANAAETQTWTGTLAKFSKTGDFTLSEKTWNIDVTWNGNAYWGNVDSSKGVQIGSSGNPARTIVLKTSDFASYNVTKVTVNASTASSATATITIKVGDVTALASKSLTTSNAAYTTDAGTYNGDIIITISQPSTSKALYVKSISIEYAEDDDTRLDPGLAFSEESKSIVLGKVFTEPTLTNNGDGAVTYTSTVTTVATVDASTGKITIVGEGTTSITATSEATENYKSGFAKYTLTVLPKGDVGEVVWSEDFSGEDPLSNYTISNGNGGGTTAIYVATLAGGTSPEVLIAKSNGSLTANVTLNGYYGDLKLTFKSNYSDRLEVTSSTTGVTVSGSATSYTLSVPEGTSTLAITLTNTNSSNVRVDDIVLRSATETINISSAGMATYCGEKSLDFTTIDNVYAYSAEVDEDYVMFTRETGVPAGQGVLVRNVEGQEAVDVEVPVRTVNALTTNHFVPVTSEISSLASEADGYVNYILNNGSQGVGFYMANGQKVGAGRAYLRVPAGSAARMFIGFSENTPTGIESTDCTEDTIEGIYTLQGRRVMGQPAKGLYIVNGKKMIIK